MLLLKKIFVTFEIGWIAAFVLLLMSIEKILTILFNIITILVKLKNESKNLIKKKSRIWQKSNYQD